MRKLPPFEDYKRRMVELSELIADQIIAACIPIESELSLNKARMLYGDKWLRKKIRYNLVKTKKAGTKCIVLREDLDRLRTEDREPPKLFFNTKKRK